MLSSHWSARQRPQVTQDHRWSEASCQQRQSPEVSPRAAAFLLTTLHFSEAKRLYYFASWENIGDENNTEGRTQGKVNILKGSRGGKELIKENEKELVGGQESPGSQWIRDGRKQNSSVVSYSLGSGHWKRSAAPTQPLVASAGLMWAA